MTSIQSTAQAQAAPKGMVETCYDPSKSVTSPETMRMWINAPITGDLTQIPGIGAKTAEALSMPCISVDGVCMEDGITNSVMLLGKFFMLREMGMNQTDHCNKFYNWLKQCKHIHSNINSVVASVAEKANCLIPGIYDGAMYAK
eukprot:gene13719-18404_t